MGWSITLSITHISGEAETLPGLVTMEERGSRSYLPSEAAALG